MTSSVSAAIREAAPRFAFVDFLRGVAALLVAYFHLQVHRVWEYPTVEIPKSSFTYRFVMGDFGLGIFGVALFFVISGFLIPSTLRGPKASVRRFAVHRFFRLYPVYWLSMGVMMLSAYVEGGIVPLPRVLANATMLQGYLRQTDMIGVYWTLQIELTFYVVCVVLFRLRKLEKTEAVLCLFLATTLACAAARFWLGQRLPVALFLGPSLMFLGDMARRAVTDAVLRRRLPYYVALVIAVIVPTCLLAYGSLARCYITSYAVAIGVFFVALRFAAVFDDTPWLRAFGAWLGETSYAMYLFHPLVALWLMNWLIARGVGKETSLGLSLALSLVLATGVYRAIEHPFIALGRKLTSKTRAPAIAAAALDDSP
jgi:peptidoglycan/LPS O-acetylase OafA/YrhL